MRRFAKQRLHSMHGRNQGSDATRFRQAEAGFCAAHARNQENQANRQPSKMVFFAFKQALKAAPDLADRGYKARLDRNAPRDSVS
jgi:hypothetical protein